MRKLAYFFALAAISTFVIFTSCKKKDDPEPTTDCSAQTFPSNTGDATVQILNFTNVSGGFVNINASAGDILALAIEVTKGTNRPQKLRFYQTDCENAKGDIVIFTGQPGLEDGGKRIDLRNTDEPQIRNVNYTVPSGFSTYYLNIEVDESGDKYTYLRIKLNISGSGIVDIWRNITLGGNTNPNPSRMSSGTGLTYRACDAAANIDYIDITYANAIPGGEPYICSNPARFQSPINLTTSSANCGEDGMLPTNGGNPTYFRAHSGVSFDDATDSDLSGLAVSTSDPQYIRINAVPVTIQFRNHTGRKGLIRVNSAVNLDNTNGTINIDVKVQR